MSILRKIKRAVRGEVKPRTVVLEALRRARSARQTRHERAHVDRINQEMPQLSFGEEVDQLEYFRNRTDPVFFNGFAGAKQQAEFHPDETKLLFTTADRITDQHAWPLMGFGVKDFGAEINWCRDPLSGYVWQLDYHRDISLVRKDGSDVRVLWEINRLGHLLTLAQAYAVSGDVRYSNECLTQLRSWAMQNPYGRGVNWTCAMEVALRVINLLAVFEMLKHSPRFDHDTLNLFLKLFHQHGTYICNNLEFTHISTSNHYLSDVTGLLWLGIMLPEFVDSEYFFDFGFAELLSEMDKQVLADGADFESSTGYHRFVLELFAYSFLLCRQNDIEIEQRYWDKLNKMFEYVSAYLRPDGLAPAIGDSDGGQVLPLCFRHADEHEYLLQVGAVMLGDTKLKTTRLKPSPELFWFFGKDGVKAFQQLAVGSARASQSFPDAGSYFMRKEDAYLCFNASGAGLNGRGSHGHNDALSIEVVIGDIPFIVDPGTYFYTGDLKQRHLFRSTAYHSTIKIDDVEQNTTLESVPFVIGDEAQPSVLQWQMSEFEDKVVAEHAGYSRLSSPVVHRRTIVFDKRNKVWLIDDEFIGDGEHVYDVRFHFAPGLQMSVDQSSITAFAKQVGLKVSLLNFTVSPQLETQATSRDYGEQRESTTACWHFSGKPGKLQWKIEVLNL